MAGAVASSRGSQPRARPRPCVPDARRRARAREEPRPSAHGSRWRGSAVRTAATSALGHVRGGDRSTKPCALQLGLRPRLRDPPSRLHPAPESLPSPRPLGRLSDAPSQWGRPWSPLSPRHQPPLLAPKLWGSSRGHGLGLAGSLPRERPGAQGTVRRTWIPTAGESGVRPGRLSVRPAPDCTDAGGASMHPAARELQPVSASAPPPTPGRRAGCRGWAQRAPVHGGAGGG